MPMISPDSRDAHFYKPNSVHSPRTGLRPRDDDKDGLVDEDGPDDMDGDGHITWMRVRDPNGKHKTHPEHPHLIIPIKPGEKGEFTGWGPKASITTAMDKSTKMEMAITTPIAIGAGTGSLTISSVAAIAIPSQSSKTASLPTLSPPARKSVAHKSYHNAGGMIIPRSWHSGRPLRSRRHRRL